MAGAYEAYEIFQQMYWAYFGLNDIVQASKSDEANTNYHYADAATFKNQWADMNTVQGSTGVEIINNNIVDGSTVIKPIKTLTADGMKAAYVIGKVAIDEITGEVDVTTDGSLFTLAPLQDTVNGVLNALGLAVIDSQETSAQDFLRNSTVKIAEKILGRTISDPDELNNIYAGIALQAETVAETGENIVKSYLDQEVIQEISDTLSDEDIAIMPVTEIADYEIGEFIHKNDIIPAFNAYRAIELAIIGYLCTYPETGTMGDLINILRENIDMLETALKSVVDTNCPYVFVYIGSYLTGSSAHITGQIVQYESIPNWWKITEKIPSSNVNIEAAKVMFNTNADPNAGTWYNTPSYSNPTHHNAFELSYYDSAVHIASATAGAFTLYVGALSENDLIGNSWYGRGASGNILNTLHANANINIDETVLYPPVPDIDIEISYPDWCNKGKDATRYKEGDDTVAGARDIPIDIPRAIDDAAYAGAIEGVRALDWADARAGVLDPAIPYPGIATITDLYDYLNRIRTIDGTRVIDITADPPTTDTPVLPGVPTLGGNARLYTVHQMNGGQLDALGSYMWSNDFISLIEHMFTNPADAVIGLHTLYYGGSLPVGTAEQIKLGSITATGVTGQPVTNRYMEFSCGTVHIQSYYGNVEDYDPYTKVQIWLPFIGFRDLATNEIMGGNVTLKYGIDVYTGSCVAMITVLRDGVTQALYSFEGNCALTEPLTGADYSRVISGLIGLGVGVATGGVGAAIGAGSMLMNKNIQYSRTGSFSANAGAMGIKTPYILIRRPIAYDANFYNEFYGIPANNTMTLGSCSGFTRVKDVHVNSISCTETERDEIVALLKQGVIF